MQYYIACLVFALFFSGWAAGVHDKSLQKDEWWVPLIAGGAIMLIILAVKGIVG